MRQRLDRAAEELDAENQPQENQDHGDYQRKTICGVMQGAQNTDVSRLGLLTHNDDGVTQ